MKKILLGLALAAAVALPGASYAATFAYVNQAGEVSTVTADTAAQALMMAPSIHSRSGVMQLSNPSDDIVGDDVAGA